ncbi:hypothetical protein HYALB_00004581 [Hymenoscyphus albidus]|uniref:Atos-like conserved domain-containing protein n=1 Tax=Hymenoscyphus albidus TaxID=595503 RepID=A0A9N9LY42_9HELO|nr:hypothetical protein HYALB_00004581 [Hymenoscyphus albidus]
MPIFQDEDLGADPSLPPTQPTKHTRSTTPIESIPMGRKLSEESIRTELCEGPVFDMPEEQIKDSESSNTRTSDTVHTFAFHATSDRKELIERLKRGESTNWLSNHNLDSVIHDSPSTPTKTVSNVSNVNPCPLQPSPKLSESKSNVETDVERVQAGLQIERPRSALHSGDFTEGTKEVGSKQANSGLFGSERQPWLATTPPRNFSPFQLDTTFPPIEQLYTEVGWRSRAPSLSSSYSSSFVLKPPTSPLVQSESNDDMELASFMNPIDITHDSQRSSRIHMLQASHSMHSTSSIPTSSSFNKPLPHLRRDNAFPYQAHQPRRSLTSNTTPYPASSPQTPDFSRSRRPSYTLDSSLLHASMVGSYEESILRGRMSTTPSKPLEFVAQIGVLGLGKCRSSLRCPAHVTLPFPAVFYSYETTSHGRARRSEDGPSPYVGQIDLENGLPCPDEARGNKRKRTNVNKDRGRSDDLDMTDGPNTNHLTGQEIRRAEKQKRRSSSPKAPLGGCYRIPEKGQLQIIIKNPNKTAVKLFLVPYDLNGMEPGTKTFIRQRSYTTGPAVDSASSSTSQNPVPSPREERPTLRYLVHLHICSPSRGRFYLYKSIRVVFADRVPDSKEKLRNEISIPDPRFSVYKPSRDSGFGTGFTGAAGASLAAEKAYRRRSSGFALGSSHRTYHAMEGITQTLEKDFSSGSIFPHGQGTSNAIPIQPIPFNSFRKQSQAEDECGQQYPSNIQSLTSSKNSRPTTSQGPDLSMSWNSDSTSIGGYGKLNKGDAGYAGNLFSGSPDGGKAVAEGLLAKRLRHLEVDGKNLHEDQDNI